MTSCSLRPALPPAPQRHVLTKHIPPTSDFCRVCWRLLGQPAKLGTRAAHLHGSTPVTAVATAGMAGGPGALPAGPQMQAVEPPPTVQYTSEGANSVAVCGTVLTEPQASGTTDPAGVGSAALLL